MATCNCKLKSGEPCRYKAKSGSRYCGKHKSCSNQASPKRASPKRASPKRASPKRASPKRKSPCPKGTVLNSKKTRCSKECSPHQIRNKNGRCVKRHSPKRPSPNANQMGNQMYPICLRFYVSINDSSEISNPSRLTEHAKELFQDAIEHKFVQRLENVSRIRITDIQLTFTNDSIILMNGLIPIPSNDDALSSWIEAIDEKSVWQIRFGPSNDESVTSNGKEYKLVSVNKCN